QGDVREVVMVDAGAPAGVVVEALVEAEMLLEVGLRLGSLQGDRLDGLRQQLGIRHVGPGDHDRQRPAIGLDQQALLHARLASISGVGPTLFLPSGPSATPRPPPATPSRTRPDPRTPPGPPPTVPGTPHARPSAGSADARCCRRDTPGAAGSTGTPSAAGRSPHPSPPAGPPGPGPSSPAGRTRPAPTRPWPTAHPTAARSVATAPAPSSAGPCGPPPTGSSAGSSRGVGRRG